MFNNFLKKIIRIVFKDFKKVIRFNLFFIPFKIHNCSLEVEKKFTCFLSLIYN